MRNLLTVVAVLLLSSVAAAQGATIKPPQPDYSKYGSYSAQLTVYENTQRRLDALELERYRKFREEIRRQTVTPQYTVVVSGRTTTSCGVERWRERRCETQSRSCRSR
ncbi:MAG: hypothetical protein MN733_06415 [Nitrososphaera sp.]|nr:hypothetical protein [Nitrososphaera sp.]